MYFYRLAIIKLLSTIIYYSKVFNLVFIYQMSESKSKKNIFKSFFVDFRNKKPVAFWIIMIILIFMLFMAILPYIILGLFIILIGLFIILIIFGVSLDSKGTLGSLKRFAESRRNPRLF